MVWIRNYKHLYNIYRIKILPGSILCKQKNQKKICIFFSTENDKMKYPDMETEQQTVNAYFLIEINWCEN